MKQGAKHGADMKEQDKNSFLVSKRRQYLVMLADWDNSFVDIAAT